MADKFLTLAPKVRLTDEASNYLRELADRVDAGEISDLVVVTHNGVDMRLERYGDFTDRWRMLGALEYAKDCVNNAE